MSETLTLVPDADPDVLNAGLDAADAAPDSDGLITSLHADYLVCVPW